MFGVLRFVGIFLLWNILVSLALFFLPALAALVTALGLTAAFLWVLIERAPRRLRHWSALRLRPLTGPALRWTLWGAPLVLAFTWALGEVYIRLVHVPPEQFDPFGGLMDEPVGRLTVTILAVAIAPLLEEFVFRGLIQSTLERRWGGVRAIAATAFLFGVVHFMPRIFPLYFILGLIFGFAVYATRSVWAGVILHAVNNSAAMVGIGMPEERPEVPTIWVTGPTQEWWAGLAALLVTGAILAHVGSKLWKAGRPGALRPVSPHG